MPACREPAPPPVTPSPPPPVPTAAANSTQQASTITSPTHDAPPRQPAN
ncbi:MAG TPA: hypothetical protein VLI90_00920 [Tepidisphaeraceae bacterium]|nr:hypothetical protein [Tepidisphaeraceae bacterium]